MLEGMLVAAHAIEAEACWIYLRDEYPHLRRMLEREIAALAAAGLRRHADPPPPRRRRLYLRRGNGAAGKPGRPPRLPAPQAALPGREGAVRPPDADPQRRDAVAAAGNPGRARRPPRATPRWDGAGARACASSASPAGCGSPARSWRRPASSARELIEEFSGGMLPGHRFAAYLPGGASGGILPDALGDLPLDFGTLDAQGCFVGSGARGGAVRPGRPGGGGAQPRAASSATRAAANARPAASAPPRRRGCWTRRSGTARCSRSWRRRWRTARSAASARRR